MALVNVLMKKILAIAIMADLTQQLNEKEFIIMFKQNFSFLLLALMLIAISSGCTSSNDPNNNKKNKNTLENTEKIEEQAIANQNRLATVMSRGRLICGVNGQLPGFSFVNEQGEYSGMDVDFCRAVAAALFDNPSKVEYRDLSTQERFTAVQSGEVDLLSRNTTWTISRDTSVGMEFAPTTFYDGQGIMATQASNIETLEDLDGKSVCVLSGTTNEQNLADRMRSLELNYAPVVFEDVDLLYGAYEQGRCEAVTSDRSQLIARRSILAKPDAHSVLDEVLSKEPLAPAVANGDSQWFDMVKWITYTMIEAEELGINSQNIGKFAQSKDPEVKRFLGVEGNLGDDMGVPNDFAKKVIRHVGNYEEIYDRNIGKPFELERGQNALWSDGGLLYSPPFR
jgi:general L-amino acid transport system substrate-binding protein